MKTALVIITMACATAWGGQTDPFGPTMSRPRGRVQDLATNEVQSDVGTDLERQQRWDNAKAALMEKRMNAAKAAIAAAREKGERIQAERDAEARAEMAKAKAEADAALREQQRKEAARQERLMLERENQERIERLAKSVSDGIRSEYRRRLIKDYIQIGVEVAILAGLAAGGYFWLKRRQTSNVGRSG